MNWSRICLSLEHVVWESHLETSKLRDAKRTPAAGVRLRGDNGRSIGTGRQAWEKACSECMVVWMRNECKDNQHMHTYRESWANTVLYTADAWRHPTWSQYIFSSIFILVPNGTRKFTRRMEVSGFLLDWGARWWHLVGSAKAAWCINSSFVD